jgi:hypothetical protein
MDEILPCPFCGDVGPEIVLDRRSYFVACTAGDHCVSNGPRKRTEEDSVLAWNTRHFASTGGQG